MYVFRRTKTTTYSTTFYLRFCWKFHLSTEFWLIRSFNLSWKMYKNSLTDSRKVHWIFFACSQSQWATQEATGMFNEQTEMNEKNDMWNIYWRQRARNDHRREQTMRWGKTKSTFKLHSLPNLLEHFNCWLCSTFSVFLPHKSLSFSTSMFHTKMKNQLHIFLWVRNSHGIEMEMKRVPKLGQKRKELESAREEKNEISQCQQNDNNN